MKTSQEWWDSIKEDDSKIVGWLMQQYHGEVTAGPRIRELVLPHFDGKLAFLVERIANDEDRHAEWIEALLESYNVKASVIPKAERYWNQVLDEDIPNGEYAAAVGAHAEEMRLERIRVICEDPLTPLFIRQVFEQIIKDETFHVKAFKFLAGEAYEGKAAEKHARGLEALGLII